jgi:peptidoglycan hydrolase-like protein with peptidoglycan-binding domain
LHLSGSLRKLLCLLCVALFFTSMAAAKSTHKRSHKRSTTATASKSTSKKTCKAARRGKATNCGAVTKRVRGQQAIDGDRAREIQEALIRANYLQGEANGVWDQRTKEAMTRFQQDNGWQTKVIPDSRALIKLGLGPNHANLLNPPVPSSAGLDPDTARGDMRAGESNQPGAVQ